MKIEICYLCKEKVEKNTRKRNYIEKLKVNFFLQGNIVLLCIAYVIENIAILKKHLQIFRMDPIIVIILR